MHKFWSLTIALIKNNLNVVTDGKDGKAKTIAISLLILICLLPLLFMIYAMFAAYFEAYGSLSQTGTVLAIGFFLTAFIIFFFSLFVIPGVFYFSKDNDILLTLPIEPHTILAAKFTNCLIYDYVFSGFVILPLAIAYMKFMPFGIWELLCFLIAIITLPIIPLIYSSIITMLVMRFVPFVKNKDTFNMISGILIVVISLGFSFYINTITGPADEAALLSMLAEGNNSMISLFSALFPFIPNAAHMIFDSDILQFIFYLLWHLGFITLFLISGKYLYFKGAIGIRDSASSSRVIDIRRHARKTPVFSAYVKKELKLLLRTPVYFLNCIMSVIIIPFMLVIILLQPELREGLASLPIQEIMKIEQIDSYITLAIILFACFAAPLNMISSTAISREGDHVSFMKFIPVSYEKQLYAKTFLGILFGIASMLPVWLAITIYLQFPLMLSICSLFGIILCNIALSMIGILIDASRPKLIWEQEASAVKQNLNGMLEFAAGLLIAFLIGAGMFQFTNDAIFYFLIGIFILFVIIIWICHFLIHKLAGKLFAKIS